MRRIAIVIGTVASVLVAIGAATYIFWPRYRSLTSERIDAQQFLTPLIHSIEVYHSEQSSYPDSLKQLGTAYDDARLRQPLGALEIKYNAYADGKKYQLGVRFSRETIMHDSDFKDYWFYEND